MRLIDADGLAVRIREKVFHDFTDEFYGVMQCIGEAPTIEIVRCGECKWYDNREGCFFSTSEIDSDGFCSFGERREQ